MSEDRQNSHAKGEAAAAAEAGAKSGPEPISDTQLRDVIRQAATRGPRPPHTVAGAGPHGRADTARLSLRHAQALRRIPVDRASRPQMLLAAIAFLLHWAATVAASVLYEHFRPTATEPAQFATLLISSLSVFAAAMVAFIELAKFTRAGRSVTIGLGFINVLIFAAVAIYARHWLIVLAQFVFALGLVALLAGRPLEREADDAGEESQPDAVRRRPLLTQIPWGWVAAGLLLVLGAWALLLVPAGQYAQKRAVSDTYTEVVEAYENDAWSDEVTKTAEEAYAASRWLAGISGYVGETEARRAAFHLRWGYLEALLGEPHHALRIIDDAQRRYPTVEGYRMRAEVYCMVHDLPFEPTPNEEELDELEPPPGHYVPEHRRKTVRGFRLQSEH